MSIVAKNRVAAMFLNGVAGHTAEVPAPLAPPALPIAKELKADAVRSLLYVKDGETPPKFVPGKAVKTAAKPETPSAPPPEAEDRLLGLFKTGTMAPSPRVRREEAVAEPFNPPFPLIDEEEGEEEE